MDARSSCSYIHHKLVSEMGIPYEYIKPFIMIMGDKSYVTSYAKCPKVLWNMQRYGFCYNLRIMELGE